MKVKDVKHKVTLDDFEHRLLVGCVNVARTMYLEQNKPTEDVDNLLVKIIKSPSKKVSLRVSERLFIIQLLHKIFGGLHQAKL